MGISSKRNQQDAGDEMPLAKRQRPHKRLAKPNPQTPETEPLQRDYAVRKPVLLLLTSDMKHIKLKNLFHSYIQKCWKDRSGIARSIA